jgi:hypothetical protein
MVLREKGGSVTMGKRLISFLLFLIIFSANINIQKANAHEIINISNNEGISESPDIGVYQQDRYVVWADNTLSEFLIYFSKYTGN